MLVAVHRDPRWPNRGMWAHMGQLERSLWDRFVRYRRVTHHSCSSLIKKEYKEEILCSSYKFCSLLTGGCFTLLIRFLRNYERVYSYCPLKTRTLHWLWLAELQLPGYRLPEPGVRDLRVMPSFNGSPLSDPWTTRSGHSDYDTRERGFEFSKNITLFSETSFASANDQERTYKSS